MLCRVCHVKKRCSRCIVSRVMREQVRAGVACALAEKLQDEPIQTGNWSAEASPQSAHAD